MMIIMNMQNKLYIICFSHHPITNLQPVPEQQSWNLENCKFCKTPEKRLNSQWTHTTEKTDFPTPTPLHRLSMTFMVWNISIGRLGLAAWLCSLPALALLIIIWVRETGRSPSFSATTENISVINIFLLLNPKHSSYWEEN